VAAPWVTELQRALPGAVLTDRASLEAYGFDASYRRGAPEAVALPTSAEQVAAVLRIADACRVPVFPRGGGTGLAGGSVPRGGVALVLRRMNRIVGVDAANLQVRAEAGVTLSDLRQAVAPHGLFYPVDPGSGRTATVGGNVATNAGGPRAFRYGTTRRYVLGLEAVLPDGRVLRLGGRTTKRSCGYDLHGLLVGSEGTLAVVTEATLRLLPAPPASGTVVAWFADASAAARAVVAIAAGPARPAALEFMDAASLRAVAQYLPEIVLEGEALLLCESLGHPGAVRAEAEEVEAACRRAGAAQVRTATDPEDQRRLWAARQAIAPAVARIRPTKVSEDATVPLAAAPEFLARLDAIAARHGVRLVVFGHAGDGNFHPNILCDERDAGEMARVEAAVDAIFAAALDLGGTLSGEHGIGLMKAPYLPRAVGPDALELMRRLKAVFDPNGILNPGKLFPPEEGPPAASPAGPSAGSGPAGGAGGETGVDPR
jgi:glycolate oxidase